MNGKKPTPKRSGRRHRQTLSIKQQDMLVRIARIRQKNEELSLSSTTARRKLLRYGRPFLETFESRAYGGKHKFHTDLSKGFYESPIEIKFISQDRGFDSSGEIGSVGLGFDSHTVIVEAIHGRRFLPIYIRNRLKKELAEPWPNLVLNHIEELARENGFKTIKIRKPETLFFYHHPFVVMREDTGLSDAAILKKIQWQMKRLYWQVARAKGFNEEEGEFYVKEL